MKTILLLAAIGPGLFANTLAATPRRLDVCMGSGTNLLAFFQAKKTTSAMLSTAGIDVTWHSTGSHCPSGSIEIKAIEGAARTGKSYALAHTWPYEGTRIEVYYDRICAVAGPSRSAVLLAHVVTHEIGHILQGISRHSGSGIMKANFDEQDIEMMMKHQLSFNQIDIDLIQDGFDSGTSFSARQALAKMKHTS